MSEILALRLSAKGLETLARSLLQVFEGDKPKDRISVYEAMRRAADWSKLLMDYSPKFRSTYQFAKRTLQNPKWMPPEIGKRSVSQYKYGKLFFNCTMLRFDPQSALRNVDDKDELIEDLTGSKQIFDCLMQFVHSFSYHYNKDRKGGRE